MSTIEKAFNEWADANISMTWGKSRSALKSAFQDGADFALANQWVSVEDAMPKSGLLVIALDKDGDYYAARYNEIAECWQDDARRFEWHGEGITHWMPIPEPNTEEP